MSKTYAKRLIIVGFIIGRQAKGNLKKERHRTIVDDLVKASEFSMT